jgi:hypothetical protein
VLSEFRGVSRLVGVPVLEFVGLGGQGLLVVLYCL